MKPFLFLEKIENVHSKSENNYFFTVSDALTNKSWVIEYDTTFEKALMYCLGYLNAKGDSYDQIVRFSHNIELDEYDLNICKITESDFQYMRQQVLKEVK